MKYAPTHNLSQNGNLNGKDEGSLSRQNNASFATANCFWDLP